MNDPQICRCCMSATTCNQSSPMEYILFDRRRMRLFRSVTSLAISKNDGLSSIICISCNKKLELFYSFKDMCIRNHRNMKKLSPISISLPDYEPNDLSDYHYEFELIDEKNVHPKCKRELLVKNETKTEEIERITLTADICNDLVATKQFEIVTSIDVNEEAVNNISNTIKSEQEWHEYTVSSESPKESETHIASTEELINVQCMQTSIGKRKYTHRCEICSKNFKNAKRLTNHHYIHLNPKLFQCDICARTYQKKYDLKRHMILHSGEKPFGCELCGKRFVRSAVLKRHMITHTGERPFACGTCGKTFARKIDLKRHALIHSGKKPYLCAVCSKDFYQLGQLKAHMLTHTGERPHICGVCQKAFSQLKNLKVHMETHDADRSYLPCPVCAKRFTTLSLKNHMVTHTDVKPHACEMCTRQFYFISQLRRHRLTHTGERPFTCPVCLKPLSRSDQLKTHLRKHAEQSKKCK